MHDADLLSSLIALIYDAMLDPREWPSFLTAITSGLGGTGAALLHHDLRGALQGNVAVSVGVDPAATEGYSRHYGTLDPWAMALVRRARFAKAFVTTSEELVPIAELTRTEYYNDFASAFGIVRNVGCGVETVPEIATTLTVLRTERHRPFGTREKRLLRALQPHLRRAFLIHHRLQRAELRSTASESALDLLSAGIVLIDSGGRVVYVNREARRLDQERDGFSIEGEGLSAAIRSESARMRALIRGALRPTGSGPFTAPRSLRLSRPSGKAGYHVLVAPIPLERILPLAGPGGVALFISDPVLGPRPTADSLRGAFGLTDAEGRLASAIAAGLTIREAAGQLGIRMSTARWFVRQLFSKTDTRSLPQLVRALIGATAAIYVARDPGSD